MLGLNKLYNMDCMEGMAQFPDKYFELAICDPPYGMKEHGAQNGGKGQLKHRAYNNGSIDRWDSAPSDDFVFGFKLFILRVFLAVKIPRQRQSDSGAKVIQPIKYFAHCFFSLSVAFHLG